MKMTSRASLSVAVLAGAAMLITSCSKSVTNYHENAPASTEKTSSSAAAESVSSPYSPGYITGTYNLRGSRTEYYGQADDQSDNIRVIYDYAGTRTVKFSSGDKGFTCGYCSDDFVNKGWMYIIRIDPRTKQVLLSPNDKMLADIKPGSFKMLNAIYDPTYKTFNFQTRYTAKGATNENEVIDILGKQ